MLVLSRKRRETIVVVVGGPERMLKVTVLEIGGGRVRLGFEGADNIPVHRLEIWEQLVADGRGRYPRASDSGQVPGGLLGRVALHAEGLNEQE